ncbi:MAG: glycosyl hydrolase [Bacteroidia bacterium]|nr:glycosyl hydrolase [Bacteroidia bacterium]
MKKLVIILLCTLFGLLLMKCTLDRKTNAVADLAENFVSPPDSARPWVYWFWLNSNISREGITADLEAMKRVGIGGVLIMEVDQGAPVGPVAFMSDQWRELFKFMISEAGRLGIEVNMNNDAGWNGSGGPWVPLGKSMQVVVASEKQVRGGAKFAGDLPKPKANSGYYRDIAVLAFPTPADPANPAWRIKNLAGKSMSSGGMMPGSLDVSAGAAVPAASMIDRGRIIDLSAMMDTTGRLTWEVPAVSQSNPGEWTIIRFGHTFTGAENAPSPLSGRGPECDKLSPEGIEANYNGMIGKLVKDVGALAGKNFAATHVDSWEVGAQNWTTKMREEFKRLRGYDMMPYMPVLTGRIVDDPEISERFLRDVRQTVSDLLAVNYIGRLKELANKDGLRLSMEAYSTPANDLDVGNYIDEPISEFWTMDGGGFWWTQKAMSSLAHVNGLPVTGAEAFTSGGEERWLAHPATIKSLGDRAFCDGVNRFIFHRYALQPWAAERKPGMTMGPWGLHYERTQTWWEDSKAWHGYLARCQYMLRQGTFVADVLCLNSEEPLQRFRVLKLNGYDYDGISPQKFMKDVTVKDGRLVLPSGMQYRLLVLPDEPDMSPAMLQKINSLVEAGATVTGKAPVRAPGLSGWPESDAQVKKMAEYLWGSGSETERKVGLGKVIPGKTPSEVLAGMDIKPDFNANREMKFIHRSVNGKEVWFIASQELQAADIVCSFRVTGMKPESWDAETGRMESITVYEEVDGCTRIPMRFEPSGSRFIVFTEAKAADPERIISVKSAEKELANMEIAVKEAVPAVKAEETRSSFTMAAWVSPDLEIALPDETSTGAGALSMVRNDVVYAAPGHEVWTNKDAGAGFGVGINGVVVSEHTADYFPALLVYPAPVAGWTHVAVVYKDNTPSLWINGKFVHKGLKSSKIVHGGYGVVHTRKVRDFSGRVAGLVQFPKALTGDEIISLFKNVPDTTTVVREEPAIDLVRREILKNGSYDFKNAAGKVHTILVEGLTDKSEIKGPWELSFQQGWGAPGTIVMDKLISWSRHTDAGVKYFSGSATYRKTFNLTAAPETGKKLKRIICLDLGRVAVMAGVKLNGKDLGLLWKAPYRVDITDVVQNGDNTLEIRVVNLWINRMIGDELQDEDSERNTDGTLKKWPQWLQDGKPSPTGRYTFTSWRLWKKNSPLQESGLLGPITIQTSIRY